MTWGFGYNYTMYLSFFFVLFVICVLRMKQKFSKGFVTPLASTNPNIADGVIQSPGEKGGEGTQMSRASSPGSWDYSCHNRASEEGQKFLKFDLGYHLHSRGENNNNKKNRQEQEDLTEIEPKGKS